MFNSMSIRISNHKKILTVFFSTIIINLFTKIWFNNYKYKVIKFMILNQLIYLFNVILMSNSIIK